MSLDPSRIAIPTSSEQLYSIQMETAYLYELHVTRQPGKGSPEGPHLEPSIVGHNLSPDGLTLSVLLRAKAGMTFREDVAAIIDCTMLGVFRSTHPIDATTAAEFSVREGLVLLWPYLRTTIADIATRLQLPFPALPTLDVQQLLQLFKETVEKAGQAANRPKSRSRRKSTAVS